MDQVKCQFDIPPVQGLNPAELTVGRHFILNCQGEWNKAFDFSKAQIKLDEKDQNTIKLFKSEARTTNSFEIDLTIYVAGSLQLPQMVLTDGTNEINLGSQQFQIKSVLEQTQPAPKPYGMILPLNLSWPVIYFVLLGILLTIFIGGLIFQLRRAANYARLMADLKNYDSSFDEDVQFYKSVRLAEKNQFPIEELEKAFRLYVLRFYQVPMFIMNNRQIIRFFKKRKPHLKNERLQIQKILNEFEEIQLRQKNFSHAEKLEFVAKLYRFVERFGQKTGDPA